MKATTSTAPASASPAKTQDNTTTTATTAKEGERTFADHVAGELDSEDAALLQQLTGDGKDKKNTTTKKEPDPKGAALEDEEDPADTETEEEEPETTEESETETETEEEEQEQQQEEDSKTAERKVPAFVGDRTKLDPESLESVVTMEKALRAIPRLTAQKHALREERDVVASERDTLKTEVESLRAAPRVQPTAANPLADIATEPELQARLVQAKATIDWAKANKKGTTLKRADGSEVEYDADAIEEIRDYNKELIDTHGPAKRQWLTARAAATEQAKKVYPKLGKEDAPRVTALLKDHPWLDSAPDRDVLIGRLLLGEDVEKGRMVALPKKKANPAATDKDRDKAKTTSRAPLSSSSRTPTPQPAGMKQDTKALFDRAAETGDMEDITRLVAAQLGM